MHNRLNVLRAEKRTSRRELAAAVGVNLQTIGSIERGEYGPSLELALRMAIGADWGTQVRLVMGQSLRLVMLGSAFGIALTT